MGETVLVVEDQEALRDVTERISTRNGYHVLTAANGPEALAVAAGFDGELRHRNEGHDSDSLLRLGSAQPGDNEPVTEQSNHDQRRGFRRLTLRGLDGVADLCPACHRDLPEVDGVVLTTVVAYAGWIILSDSGPNGDRLEDLHATLGEGPRTDVVTTGRLVSYADLTHAQAYTRWPRFAAQALASGIQAVFAFPVRLDAKTVGVLSVYRATAGPLSDADHRQVNRYAHTASVLFHAVAHVTSAGAVSMPLPGNAAEVQQAVGAVMQHTTVDAVTALHHLRASAHRSRRPMRDVVAEARTGHLPFNPTTPE